MTTKSLSLTPVVDVIINLGYKSAARKGFNLGLIIGDSVLGETTDPVIPSAERVRVYTNTDDMLTDGYTANSPEYKAAILYFSAKPIAPRRLAIGCKLTAETVLEAVQACRTANSEWYLCTVCEAEAADIKLIAAYVETAQPTTAYFYTIDDSDVLSAAGSATDIFIFMKGKKYRRTLGQYCSQTDTPDAVAAILGYAMGNNTGLANSAYTLAYKTETGVTVEKLTNTQVEYIKGNNGNVYINRGEYYDMFEQGFMADGTSFDELLNLDMLANSIQLNVMDLLYNVPKIPQTEPGVTQIINVINKACIKSVNMGFIAAGQWNGSPCLTLKTGDYLPQGYVILSEAVNDQDQADRDARKAPPIYVCVKLAGAIEFVTIQVNVNR